MIRRTTWVIIGVFVLVLALALFLQRTQKNAAANATPTAGQANLFQFDEQSITNLIMEDGQGQQVVIGRGSDGLWQLTTPSGHQTDVAQVEAGITQLVTLHVVTTLNPPPAPQDVGLATPAYTITATLKDGHNNVARVGAVSPTGSGYYVKVDDGPVIVVSKFGMEDVLKLLQNPPVLVTPTPTSNGIPQGAAYPGPVTPQMVSTGNVTPATLVPTEAETTTAPAVTATQVVTATSGTARPGSISTPRP